MTGGGVAGVKISRKNGQICPSLITQSFVLLVLTLTCSFFTLFVMATAALRLLLDFVLLRAGKCLIDTSTLFTMPSRAYDLVGACAFVEQVQACTGQGAHTLRTLLDAGTATRPRFEPNNMVQMEKRWFRCDASIL